MELMTAIRGRRSVRAFRPDRLARSEIESLIEAAIQAPSAVNEQSWGFVVIEDQAVLQRYSDAIKPGVLANLGSSSLPASFAKTLADPAYHVFHGAAALIVLYATSRDSFAAINCCLAAQNLMLAAFGQGLGSCWIGLAQGWLDHQTVKTELGIPADWSAVAPIIVGHPNEIPPAPPRASPKVIWRE